MSPGYFADPAATAEKYSGDWLKTGDLAIRRGDGAYEIAGRIKSIIMSGGFLIAPDEVDEALTSHPAVVEEVTVGIPEPDFGEIPVSAVVLDAAADELELIAHCGRLSRAQQNAETHPAARVDSTRRGGKTATRTTAFDHRSPDWLRATGLRGCRHGRHGRCGDRHRIAGVSRTRRGPFARQFAADGYQVELVRRHRVDPGSRAAGGPSIPIAVATGIKSLRELVDVLREGGSGRGGAEPPPFGVFIGTSLVAGAFPPRHPANDIFPAAAASEYIVTIAFSNQSEKCRSSRSCAAPSRRA